MRLELDLRDFGVLGRILQKLRNWFSRWSTTTDSSNVGGPGSSLGQEVVQLNGERHVVESATVTVEWGQHRADRTGAWTVTDQEDDGHRFLDGERWRTAQQMVGMGGEKPDFESDEPHRGDGGPGICGWDPEEGLTYENFMAVVHPEDREALRRQQRRAIETGLPIDLEYRIVPSNGDPRVVHEQGEARMGEDGTPVRFSGTMLDVTEQKRRKRRIERLRKKCRALLEGVPDAVLVAEAETGEIVEANSAAAALFEAPVEDLVGRHQSALHPSAKEEEYRALFERHKREAGAGSEMFSTLDDGSQIYVVTDTGEQVPVEINASFVEVGGEDFFVGVFRDITRRYRAEQRRDLFEQAVAQSGDMILIADAEGTIQYANPAAEEITGYAREELIGEAPSLLRSSETPDRTYEQLWSALERGETFRGTLTDRQKDGSLVEIEQTITPLQNGTGEVAHYVSTGRDITKRVERKEELQRHRNLLEQTQRLAGAWEADLQTGQMSWSREVYRIHDLDPDADIQIEESFAYYVPEARPEVREAFNRCVEERKPFDLEVPITTAEGEQRWVHVVGAPAEIADGTVTKVAGAVQDLTQRRRAEQALQEREARLRGLANSIPGVVYQFYARPDGTYGHHFVSEHAEEVLGLSPDPADFHERVAECIPADYREEMSRSIEKAIEEEEPWHFETPFEKPSGERIWLRGLSTPERREDELVFNGVMLDITDRKEAEQALQEERDRFAMLFDSLPTPVIRGTVQSGQEDVVAISNVNSAFEKVFGVEEEQVRGKNLHELIVPDDRQDEAASINREAMEEGILRTEVERLAADGLRDFHLQAAMREQADGPAETYAIYSDITERKRMEKELRARERWIRSITENASGGIFRSTREDGIRYANEAFLSMFGYEDLEDLRGTDPRALCANPSEWKRLFRISKEEGELECAEVELQRADGSTFVGLLSSTSVPVGDEAPVYYDGVVTDITEEHRRRQRRRRQQDVLSKLMTDDAIISGNFEAAVRKITEEVAEVLDVAGVTIWLLDEDDRRLRSVDFYDRTDDRHSAGDTLDADRYPEYFEALATHHVLDVNEVGSDSRTAELAEGYLEERGVGALLGAALHSEGEVVGVISCEHRGGSREWTDDEEQFAGEVAELVHRAFRNREQAERQRKIAFQQSLLKAQQEAVLDGVLVVDEDGRLVSYNDRFAEIWDLPDALLERDFHDEALFDRVTAQVRDPQQFREKIEYLYEHPTETSRDEIEFRDGRVLDRYSTPLIGKDGTHYGRLWTFRDITDQKERERELKEAKEKAEEASQLKTAMLANMSHEIRTPLTTIIGFSEMLTDQLNGETKKFAEKAHKSSQRLMNTLDSVIQLSKLESGVHELDQEPVRLDRVAKETAEMHATRAEEKSIALEASMPEEPVKGLWNEGALTRIAENLIENAIKFTPKEGRVEVRVWENGEEAVLEVEDTGIGISEEFQSHMFRAFKQESEGLRREYEGTGLGLSIVQRLTETLDGELQFESEKGEGTCFTVRFRKEGARNGKKGTDGASR